MGANGLTTVCHPSTDGWWMVVWLIIDAHGCLWTASQNLLIGLSTINAWSWHSKMLLCQWTLRDGNKFYNFVCDQCPALWRHTISLRSSRFCRVCLSKHLASIIALAVQAGYTMNNWHTWANFIRIHANIVQLGWSDGTWHTEHNSTTRLATWNALMKWDEWVIHYDDIWQTVILKQSSNHYFGRSKVLQLPRDVNNWTFVSPRTDILICMMPGSDECNVFRCCLP